MRAAGLRELELTDREGFFRAGIISGLRGDRNASALSVMENEQRFTLQDYMDDRVDWGWSDRMAGSWDIVDRFYLGAFLRDIALVFAARLPTVIADSRYIVPWTGGNVTEVADRLAFTRSGVERFIDLYYGNERDYMAREMTVIRSFARVS